MTRSPLPAAALAVLLSISPVFASDPPARGGEGARPLTLDEAAALVRERVGGRVVRADTREEPAGRVYVFRVVSADGRVRDVRVDAGTGALE